MSQKIKKVLVTGGAGFVGQHMIDALLRKGYQVRVIDNFMCSSPKSLARYKGKIDFIRGDIRNAKKVKAAVKGMDAVFHFAAIRSVVKTVEDPLVAHDVNATATLLLLHHAQKAGVKHFIFTSTSAVYGASISKKQREDQELLPISPYGIAKLLAEKYADYYYSQKNLPTTCVRIFNVYGPRQNPDSKYSLAVPGILSKILKGQAPQVDGDGKQERDFIYIDDILSAFFLILENPKSYGKVYNLGYGQTFSINTLVKNLLMLTHSALKPVHTPRRPGDPERTCADISKIKNELGWTPKFSLEKGLERVVRWTNQNGY